MRHPITLIGAVKCLIPKEQSELLRQLNSIVSSAEFAPLELNTLHFERITEAFDPHCNPPKEEWQLLCCAILMNKHIDDIRAMVEKYREGVQEKIKVQVNSDEWGNWYTL